MLSGMNDAAQAMIDAAYAARARGDRAAGLRGYIAAAEALRGLDAPQRLAHTVRHVADIQRELGHHEAALANYTEALAIYRADAATGKLDLGNTLRGYALLMQDLGDRTAARALWAEAGELYEAVGVQAGIDEARRQVEALGR